MLVGIALLFWGWQSGMVLLAAVLAAVLEGARFVKARWNFSQADLNRIVNLCAFLFVGAMAMALLSNQGLALLDARPNTPVQTLNKTAKSVQLFVQWMPLVFFPIMVAQAYGQAPGISLIAFSWLMRRRAAQDPAFDPGLVNMTFPYFAVCVLAASTTTDRAAWFYPCMAGLLVWALWSQRVPRFAPAVTALVVVLVCTGGYAGNYGIRGLQGLAMRLDSTVMSRWSGRDFDPQKHRSLLGAIGRLKKSGKIVLWVKATGEPPTLLREASYDLFTSPVWHLSNRDFEFTASETNQTTWKLLPDRATERAVSVSRLLSGDRGVLAVPNGTLELRQMAVYTLETNAMGALRVRSPGFLSYDALYGAAPGIDTPPTQEDTRVPPKEAEVIARIASELKLAEIAALSTNRAVEAVENFLRRNFSYSLYLEPGRRHRGANRTAIGQFLIETRKGHCEYFAAATVLLLRQAEIPARYAVGYSVQEGSGKGSYIVRERHAHAWCLAWINGQWRDIDTTPPAWNLIESQRAAWWEPISDAWSKLWLNVSRARWNIVNYKRYALWISIPAVAGLAIMVYKRRQWTRAKAGRGETPRLFAGRDSEFYLVENRLQELGLSRQRGEPLGAWLRRVNGVAPQNGVPLEDLLALHYRYRFDPDGLPAADRSRLRHKATEWVREAKRVQLNQDGSA